MTLLNASPFSVYDDPSLREILTAMSARLVAVASVTMPVFVRRWDAAGTVTQPEAAALLRGALGAFAGAIHLAKRELVLPWWIGKGKAGFVVAEPRPCSR